jgi:hypothetical protein
MNGEYDPIFANIATASLIVMPLILIALAAYQGKRIVNANKRNRR